MPIRELLKVKDLSNLKLSELNDRITKKANQDDAREAIIEIAVRYLDNGGNVTLHPVKQAFNPIKKALNPIKQVDVINYCKSELEKNPNDSIFHYLLGMSLTIGEEAFLHLIKAAEIKAEEKDTIVCAAAAYSLAKRHSQKPLERNAWLARAIVFNSQEALNCLLGSIDEDGYENSGSIDILHPKRDKTTHALAISTFLTIILSGYQLDNNKLAKSGWCEYWNDTRVTLAPFVSANAMINESEKYNSQVQILLHWALKYDQKAVQEYFSYCNMHKIISDEVYSKLSEFSNKFIATRKTEIEKQKLIEESQPNDMEGNDSTPLMERKGNAKFAKQEKGKSSTVSIFKKKRTNLPITELFENKRLTHSSSN